MRTTLNIDETRLKEAVRLSGIGEKTAVVRAGLEALIARESARRLAAPGWQRTGYSEQSADADRHPAVPVHMLVDTSVWAGHFRRGDAALSGLLSRAEVECHPFIIGELACGSLPRRCEVLSLLESLPHVPVVPINEVLTFVERHRLMGRGIGWIDARLLASASLAGVPLWTRDPPLSERARMLHLYGQP